ncbi:DUF1800 domain-containing protein, partial [Candidatus Sumerlaeota bacterium]|nr:DUF1800 domain-containing protein [Candidatus Sumerlaeota bacterium]
RHEWNRAIIWWANRMVATPRPLEEKMTLFWHGHFAAEQEKVRDYRLMLDQIAMLRENATGNFRDLLLGIARDPAMLIYLDNRENVRGHANENFAREVMELFSLGIGNYTEDDIKEAARAFTGWGSFGRRFLINSELHDEESKTVLGKTGDFDGEDVIDIILEQDAAADFIARKIYRFFVREDVSAEVNSRLAQTLRGGGYELKALLKQIFLSRDFYSPASYATHIKSPAEFLISSYRKLGLAEVPGTPQFAVTMGSLGQNLGNPPNVKGWDGGRSWINPSTLLVRGNIMRHVLFPDEAGDTYYLGPFTARYQRYQYAPKEAADRDREIVMGAAPASRGGEPMMEGSAIMEGGPMMKAPSATMINETPQYDLPLGVYNGMNRAFETVRPIPSDPAKLDLRAIAMSAGIATAGDALAYFERRFLRLPLEGGDRDSILAFLRESLGGDEIDFEVPGVERSLRELLHLIMSTPEYQLG